MIPLSIPHLAGNEWQYVKECLDTGWVSSAGAYVGRFEQMVADFVEMPFGVATSNGTTGLHLALHLLGIGAGDQVIVPNITFIASANAVAYTGAEAVFIDVDPHSWQMDLDLLEAFLAVPKNRSKVKAIMPVHVLGNMCDMPRLMRLADQYDIPVIEDSTEALGSSWNGQPAGSFGLINVFSFNGNKIITTGGGGVMVTRDESLAKRAKHLSTQSKVNPTTYYHDEMGFNYRLVNVLAAIGVAQMEQLPDFIQKKKAIDAYYREQLTGVGDLRFQQVDDAVDPNCWLFTMGSQQQPALLAALEQAKIIARPFWYPMNQLPMYTHHIYVTQEDHARRIHAECLSIPSSVSLTEAELARVVDVIKKAF